VWQINHIMYRLTGQLLSREIFGFVFLMLIAALMFNALVAVVLL